MYRVRAIRLLKTVLAKHRGGEGANEPVVATGRAGEGGMRQRRKISLDNSCRSVCKGWWPVFGRMGREGRETEGGQTESVYGTRSNLSRPPWPCVVSMRLELILPGNGKMLSLSFFASLASEIPQPSLRSPVRRVLRAAEPRPG